MFKLIIGTIFNLFVEIYRYISYLKYYFFSYPSYVDKKEEINITDNLEKKDTLRILNWNIHYGRDIFENNTIYKMCEFINDMNIDICIFQEVCVNKKYNQVDIIKKLSGFKYEFFYSSHSLWDYKKGNIIISRIPFMDKRYHQYKKFFLRPNNNIMSVKIKHNEDEIWLTNTHLACDITGYQQSEQINELIDYIDKNEKNIICGDFNSINYYESIKKMKTYFNSGIKKKTYPSVYPLYQLDYVLHNNIVPRNIERIKNKLSDHCPILIEI